MIPWTLESLLTGRYTFAEAENFYRQAIITRETFNAFAYAFRDMNYRYSSVGKSAAEAHARENGLPLPYTDRDA